MKLDSHDGVDGSEVKSHSAGSVSGRHWVYHGLARTHHDSNFMTNIHTISSEASTEDRGTMSKNNLKRDDVESVNSI